LVSSRLLIWRCPRFYRIKPEGGKVGELFFTGFPRWFEMACILTPLLFIGLCWAMVKFIYRDIPLEDDDAA
jgi:uncharacterized membrane protein YhdT